MDFTSDYNLFHLTGSAKLALWGTDEITTLEDWFFEVGQGLHSQMADPLLVDPNGGDNVLGYSTTPLGGAQIVDNGGPGFSSSGSWDLIQGSGYNGSYLRKSSGSGTSTATWTFNGLRPGAYYSLATTWVANFSAAGVRYTTRDGAGVALVQQVSPSGTPDDFADAGVFWEDLGVIRVVGSTLTVTLSIASASSVDAVRLQRIEGDLGRDDDFHVVTTSPAVDQGDPDTFFLAEPDPNGGIANQGAYGNTAEAAASPPQSVQPGALAQWLGEVRGRPDGHP